jgi:hypothetical protein
MTDRQIRPACVVSVFVKLYPAEPKKREAVFFRLPKNIIKVLFYKIFQGLSSRKFRNLCCGYLYLLAGPGIAALSCLSLGH